MRKSSVLKILLSIAVLAFITAYNLGKEIGCTYTHRSKIWFKS